MSHQFPPTALETPDCPPHLYLIDKVNVGTKELPVRHEVGVCLKCGQVTDFTTLRKPLKRRDFLIGKMKLGGEASAKTRKRKQKGVRAYATV